MSEPGYYYLHANGDLIWKKFWPGEDGSDLVKKIWPCDPSDREDAWRIILEGLSAGARLARVKELAGKWGCDLRDFVEMLVRVKAPSAEMKTGADTFLSAVAGIDPERFWPWLAATPKGQEPDFGKLNVAA